MMEEGESGKLSFSLSPRGKGGSFSLKKMYDFFGGDSVKVSTGPAQIKKGAVRLPRKTKNFCKADIGIQSKLQIGLAFQGSE